MSHMSHVSYIYKTGDIARCFEDGNMQFLGRKDHQVKIRGFRVELGEIEAQLLSHSMIRDGVVLDREDAGGSKYLCAYYVLKNPDEGVDKEELKAHLAKELPEYMIPSYFTPIETIPLTANGKLDRKALPEPGLTVTAENVYAPPENETQEKLVETWSEVLFGKEASHGPIGIDDDFFELGGHSLTAATMVFKIHKTFKVKVPLKQVFMNSTIREFAQYLKKAAGSKFISIEKVEKKEYYKMSSAQKRLFILWQSKIDDITYNMPFFVQLSGEFDTQQMSGTFKKLTGRHESLRTSFMLIGNEPVQKVHDNVEFYIKYYDLTTGGESLPSLNLRYKDFAGWQNRLLRSGGMKKQETYWLKEFERPIPVLKLPLDFPRPAVQHFQGDTVEFELPPDQSDQLKVLARTGKVTMFTLLFTLYNVFLYKLSGQEDIVVGTVVAGRRHADLEKLIGMFVNTLALRNYPTQQMTFGDFLQAVNRRTLEALENQDYQFEDLVEKVLPSRDTGRNPLFDTVFTYTPFEPMPGPGPQPIGKELKASSYDFESTDTRVKFDMVLAAADREKTIHFSIAFSTKLFKKETIQRFSNYFKELISKVLENKKNKLKDFKIYYDLELTNADVYKVVESDFEF